MFLPGLNTPNESVTVTVAKIIYNIYMYDEIRPLIPLSLINQDDENVVVAAVDGDYDDEDDDDDNAVIWNKLGNGCKGNDNVIYRDV